MRMVFKYSFVILFCLLQVSCLRKDEGEGAKTTSVFYDREDKLWLHRVKNSKEVISFQEEFNGYELDVVFEKDKGVFDLRHNVEDPFTSYTLRQFLSELEDIDQKYFWIDFKNLNRENLEQSTLTLEKLVTEYHLKNNVIVESWNWRELLQLSAAGFYVSYWAPAPTKVEEEAVAVRNIKEVLNEGSINALSGDYKSFSFFQKYFSDCNIHLWTNGLKSEEDKKIINSLSKKEFVKVILVDYSTNFLKKDKHNDYSN